MDFERKRLVGERLVVRICALNEEKKRIKISLLIFKKFIEKFKVKKLFVTVASQTIKKTYSIMGIESIFSISKFDI